MSNDIDFALNKIIIGTTQTVIRRQFINGKPDVFIIDEAHLHLDLDDDSECATRKYLSHFKDARYIGFTATPFRKNTPIFGSKKRWKLVNQIDTIQLLRDGYLSPIRSVGTLSKKINAEDEDAVDKVEIEQLSEKIVEESCRLISLNGRTRTFVFARDSSHAELLETLFNKRGAKAKAVMSSRAEKENLAAIRWFREGKESKVLISINMLLTGVDIPEVDCLVLARNFSSYNSLIQCLGRGLRKFKGKLDCIVLDFGSRNHSSIASYIVYGEIVEQRKSSSLFSIKSCSQCGTDNTLRALICTHCGNKFSFRVGLNGESRLHDDLLPIKTKIAKVVNISEKIEKNAKVYHLTCDNNDVVICARREKIEIGIGSTVVYEKGSSLNILLSSC